MGPVLFVGAATGTGGIGYPAALLAGGLVAVASVAGGRSPSREAYRYLCEPHTSVGMEGTVLVAIE